MCTILAKNFAVKAPREKLYLGQHDDLCTRGLEDIPKHVDLVALESL